MKLECLPAHPWLPAWGVLPNLKRSLVRNLPWCCPSVCACVPGFARLSFSSAPWFLFQPSRLAKRCSGGPLYQSC